MIPYRHLPGCLLGRCNNFPIHPSIHCIEQVLASGRRVSIPKLLFVIDSSSSSLIKTSLGSIGQYLNSLTLSCLVVHSAILGLGPLVPRRFLSPIQSYQEASSFLTIHAQALSYLFAIQLRWHLAAMLGSRTEAFKLSLIH